MSTGKGRRATRRENREFPYKGRIFCEGYEGCEYRDKDEQWICPECKGIICSLCYKYEHKCPQSGRIENKVSEYMEYRKACDSCSNELKEDEKLSECVSCDRYICQSCKLANNERCTFCLMR